MYKSGTIWKKYLQPLNMSRTITDCFVICVLFTCLFPSSTVMKSGSELVKAGVRAFFENAAEDLEKTLENLKLGKFTHSRTQMKGVSQNINYTTVALLPILTSIFEHVARHQFGVDLLCKFCNRNISTTTPVISDSLYKHIHWMCCWDPTNLENGGV